MIFGARGGKILKKDGKFVNCACCGVPGCCDFAELPATASLTLTIDALTPITDSMFKAGQAYFNDTTTICDLGDGHREIQFNVSIVCAGDSWSLTISYGVYTDGVLGNFADWDYTFPAGETPEEFTLSCDPFHVHFEGGNTSGVDGDGPTLACGGRDYPFNSTPGTINAILDIVVP